MSVSLRELTKRYGGATVLDAISMTVENGEIHALLGGNGAGKSTLIKCVSGAVVPDDGEILLDDRVHRAMTPREAMQSGVAVVYQDLSVVDSLSVADNIFLGTEKRIGPFVLKRKTIAESREWLDRLGGRLDPRQSVGSLGGAERQIVEIAKALRRRPAVLILDEPTAALTEAEAERLAGILRGVRAEGQAILFVTHRLAEVFDLADRVTVLRGGKVVLTGLVRDVSREDLVRAIAGRNVMPRSPAPGTAGAAKAANGLEVRGLVAPGVGPIDITVPSGQVLGIFGLVGSGRTELLEAVFGARKRRSGTVSVAGRPLAGGVTEAIAAGLALVPSDRLRNGVIAAMRADDNVLLPKFSPLARLALWRNRVAEREDLASVFEGLDVRPAMPALEAQGFSGGNQQKLVVGRWMSRHAKCSVILLDEPTNGVDVGGRSELYDAVRAFAGRGNAAVLTSSEPSELLQISDRILVLARGRAVLDVDRSEASEEMLISAAHRDEPMETPA
jgi:ABC-type sugar transport system ATPase subunit